mgnify:CR=1 FL=1
MSSSPQHRWLVIACLFAVYVIWGSTYLAMRIAVEGLPPFLMAGTRFILTGLILFAFLKARGAPTPTRREWLASVPVLQYTKTCLSGVMPCAA